MILIRVDRGRTTAVHIGVDTRHTVTLVNTREIAFNHNRDEMFNYAHEGDFFTIPDDRHGDVQRIVKHLAEQNPGREVQVFTLEKAATCPASAMVMKQVTKDGILPATF